MAHVFTRGLIVLLLAAAPAWAHKPSDSYLHLDASGEALQVRWDIALKDLDFLLALDADQDSQITWGEVKTKRDAIFAHALSRVRLARGGDEVTLTAGDLLISDHSDGSYAVLMIATDCPAHAGELSVWYDLLFDADPTHRGLVRYETSSAVSTHVLSPESPDLVLRPGEVSLWSTFVDYTREGVWHIWIGFDHILFLLTLLFPAVLIRKEGAWQPVEEFLPALKAVLRIVTVFTIAHSITLWLSVAEYVSLPSQWVEATIAFSIIVTACHNLRPVLPVSNWVIAFAFGLIHGFGFANVLLDLGLSDTALAISLFGFNVGVELGQMAIVFAFLPVAFALRSTSFYRRGVLQVGSAAVAMIACVWVYERVCNVEVLGL